jgi:hypothetical protein
MALLQTQTSANSPSRFPAPVVVMVLGIFSALAFIAAYAAGVTPAEAWGYISNLLS